ncbi:uncharacterized protein EAF02_009460 [Botrytis sinoallii]|uniref:uncharacterized protein n=1 Tax=Botrytis sinoallii TaxID=1463999 RepID=UPI0019004EB0|nr:uncharacterized protein EAF02_009460 [Botrytis sinoallii]KAF7868724.1 hypothetical protein EAF02_009460 [Botrytis sinoallii]
MTTAPDSNNDFKFARRGLIRAIEDRHIYSDPNPNDEQQNIVWDTKAYDFLAGECPDTAKAALWRQGQLCNATAGLYLVTEGVYQIRGLDLANMSIVRIPGTNGIIIIDCLTSVETARKAIELYQQWHVEKNGQEAEIKALFYTHCDVDHFGGAAAIVLKAKEQGQTIRIFGPQGFLEHAVSENVYAGAAISRRSIYLYGMKLSKSPAGQIGCGLGQCTSTGKISLVAPIHYITQNGDLVDGIEGLQIICQLTPGTEAPAEVNYYLPDYKALCAAENATHTLHNIQTLRGAPVRDARLWSRYLDESITLFGNKTDVVFAGHHWPTWNDNENLVLQFLSEQRDYYAYLHNESLRQINDGQTPLEIAENIQMPPNLSAKTHLQGHYGSISHNVKGVYDKYMGWFNGNPAYLWPLQPTDEAAEFVKYMGGNQAVLDMANEYIMNKNLRFAATLLDKLVFKTQGSAEKDSDIAKQAMLTLDSVYNTLRWGSENATWRNFYLTGARELQFGPQKVDLSMSPEALLTLSFDELFDTIAIKIEGPAAFTKPEVYLMKEITIDFMVSGIQLNNKPSAGWHLRLSNAAMTGHAIPYVASSEKPNPGSDLTIWLDHVNLARLIGATALGRSPVIVNNPYIALTTAGDVDALTKITALIRLPSADFNIVTP